MGVFGVCMAAKSGGEHHTRVKLVEDQSVLLRHVSSGVDVFTALAMVGRRDAVLKVWLKDSKFAVRLEEAQSVGADSLAVVVASGGKENLDYATFSKEFLGLEVFPHQQSWIDVIQGREPGWLHEACTYEPGNPKRLLVNVPPEHAKSTVMTVGFVLYSICMNPNIRVAIVSQGQERAKEFLYAIKQRLTEEPWAKLQQVYGPAGGWKQGADQWTQDRIYLNRSSGDPNPTVQALGFGSQIYGARLDLIILDDIVGTTNAHEWTKQLNWLQKMVITRLGPTGTLLVAGTRVSAVDLYKEIRNPDHWSGGKSPFTYLAMPAVLEFAEKREDWKTLWNKSNMPWDGAAEDWMLKADEDGLYPKWDGRTLFQRRSEVSPSTWALVYQQQDVEEDAIFPLVAVNGSINRMRKAGPIHMGAPGHPKDGEWVSVMGLDPAMSGKTAAIMYAIDRISGKRLILDAHNMSEPTPGKIRALIEEWITRYRPIELRVEINAYQKAFSLDENLSEWLRNQGVQFREHFTGKNKWDVNFGVASMSNLFGYIRDGKHNADNLIELPDQTNEHIKALVNQLITWKPDTKNATDLVMALWFCEIRAKELIQNGTYRSTHIPNRWSTRRNDNQRGYINLDMLAAEQNTIYV